MIILFFMTCNKVLFLKTNHYISHYDYVMSSLGNSYKGANKIAYGNILQAIQTIVTCKQTHPRRTEKCKEAVGYLHQDMSNGFKLYSEYTVYSLE